MTVVLCERFARNFAFTVCLFIASAAIMACGKNATTTSPTSPAPDSVTETFAGTLSVGGSAFYSFSTAVTGDVTATLTNIGGDGVPSSVVVNLGIGSLSGFNCSASSTAVQIMGTAQVSSLVTSSEPPGVHCVVISDIGNLFSPATFTVTIAHPLRAAS